MPQEKEKTLADVAAELGLYPLEAYEFVNHALAFTVSRIHGKQSAQDTPRNCHVSGQELCQGLRDLARTQWGFLAGTVLRRWNIYSTIDFGRIVFAMVENGMMAKTEKDSLEDFRNVYDFAEAFDSGYRIGAKS